MGTTIRPPWTLTVCGIEELAGHCEAGATHVLSILDPTTDVPEAFGRWGEHEKLELRFHDIVEERPGLVAPGEAEIGRILAFGADLARDARREDAHLLVHCHAGISRSTASMSLILAQARPDAPAADIMRTVLSIRDKAWPNLRMIEFGDRLLGRGGALVAAATSLHALQLARRPDLATFMSAEGRGREIEAATGVPALAA